MGTKTLLSMLALCLAMPVMARAETDDDDDFDDREEAWEDYRESIEWARRCSFRHALSEVNDALEKLPDQGEFLLQKGFVLLELCHTTEAVDLLKKAQAAGPERVTRQAEEELICMGELEPGDRTKTDEKSADRAAKQDPPHPKHYGHGHAPPCCEGGCHP